MPWQGGCAMLQSMLAEARLKGRQPDSPSASAHIFLELAQLRHALLLRQRWRHTALAGEPAAKALLRRPSLHACL